MGTGQTVEEQAWEPAPPVPFSLLTLAFVLEPALDHRTHSPLVYWTGPAFLMEI